jgi:hypothetical protein
MDTFRLVIETFQPLKEERCAALLTMVGVLTALVLPACSPSGGAVVPAGIGVLATDSRVSTEVVVLRVGQGAFRQRGNGSHGGLPDLHPRHGRFSRRTVTGSGIPSTPQD